MSLRHVVFLLLSFVNSLSLYAQEVYAQEDIPPASVSTSDMFFKPGYFFLSFYGGGFSPTDEPQFVDIRHRYTLGAGISADLAQYPHWALDLELFFINRDYDTPLGPLAWGSIDDDTSVQTNAALFGGRAFYPLEGPFRAYASAGLGYFKTRMVVYGSLFGFPGSYEDTDTRLELYYGAGLSYRFGSWGLSLDYRHFNLKGSFSAFEVQNANLGGDALLAGWSYAF